ncbi:MAG TPA: pilus assembly PilX N-terminal domain-containing protein [Candidatus Saccharimonadales bacterium]|nr:pilus assembly PilX N-terminal domain-containing protein [Candidatus Saccharimonadales bacterium]
MNRHIKLDSDQSGIASILVTIIMMIIVSLIVLGFGQLSNREQSEALDRQLSTQAFYAAESGVNDATAAVSNFLVNNPGGTISPSKTCEPPSPYITGTDTTLLPNRGSNSTVLAYTCLLVTPTPSTLVYADIKLNQSQIIYIDPGSGSFSQLMFSWQDSSGLPPQARYNCNPDATDPTGFPPTASWGPACGAGVLRIDVVPATGLNAFTQDNVYFLYPASGPENGYGRGNLASSPNGSVLKASCYTGNSDGQTMPESCNLRLKGLDGGAYYLRVLPIYDSQSLTISSPDPTDVSKLSGTFNGDQIQVDSTGRAGTVLRRIRAYVPIQPSGSYPDFAIQSTTSICKEFDYIPGSSTPVPPPPGISYYGTDGCAYP